MLGNYFLVLFFKTGSQFVILAVLQLAMYTRLVLNSQRFPCLYPLGAGIEGICYHAWYNQDGRYQEGMKVASNLFHHSSQ